MIFVKKSLVRKKTKDRIGAFKRVKTLKKIETLSLLTLDPYIWLWPANLF